MAGLNKKLVTLGLFLAMAVMVVSGDDSVLCGMSAQGLMACRPSVSGADTQVPPTKGCFTALTGAYLKCLCGLKNRETLLIFYSIDPKQAMALPALCDAVDHDWHC